MPDLETPDAPEPAPEGPAPEPAPTTATKALFIATADVFGALAGSVWSLTPAQAAEGGDALQALPAEEPARKFILAAWGRAPFVRD